MTSDIYQAYHEAIFLRHGISKYGWTATMPLEMAEVVGGEEAREALWASMLNDSLAWSGAMSVFNVESGAEIVGQDDPRFAEAVNWLGVTAALLPGSFASASNIYGNYNFLFGSGRIIGGNETSDSLSGSSANDIIMGFGDNDLIDALAGDDVVYGGLANDILIGGMGRDHIVGGSEDDQLTGEVVHWDPMTLAGFTLEGDGVGDILDGGEGYDLYGVVGSDEGDPVMTYTENGWVTTAEMRGIVNGRHAEVTIIRDSDGRGEIWTDTDRYVEEYTTLVQDGIILGPTGSSFRQYAAIETFGDGSVFYNAVTDERGNGGYNSLLVFSAETELGVMVDYAGILEMTNGHQDYIFKYLIEDWNQGDFGIFTV